MHGFDDSDSDDETEPLLFVRGKESTDIEAFVKFVNKATVQVNELALGVDGDRSTRVQPSENFCFLAVRTDLSAKTKPKFDGPTYFHKLKTTSLGAVMMSTVKMPSTQTFLKE
eukprot:2287672-Pyramimonas_sp.AAC.1